MKIKSKNKEVERCIVFNVNGKKIVLSKNKEDLRIMFNDWLDNDCFDNVNLKIKEKDISLSRLERFENFDGF
ncbi:hypothetical protein [Tenacibaculum sp. 190524A02b]|uniref:Uncharacterized protein n=1 Tax=Tenacibaculum vairaonense TaxID=3137860 RepID=A0ABP1FDG7_9FLAO